MRLDRIQRTTGIFMKDVQGIRLGLREKEASEVDSIVTHTLHHVY